MFEIALLLGLIEGLTEFIPVSSTAHLILFGEVLGFEGPPGKTFEIVIQLGAIFAVCWLYRAKLASTTVGLVKKNAADWRFATGIVIAFLPAMVIGALFHDFIKSVLFNPVNVSVMLILGGIVILAVERMKLTTRYESLEAMTLPLCLKIGFCQCLAMIPGTSRSGATIIGALLLGVERKTATEFSFFLAIPTMFAATIFDLWQSWDMLTADGLQLIAAGFTVAFVSALFVVRTVVNYIARHGFAPFAYYRIALGSVMLMLLL